ISCTAGHCTVTSPANSVFITSVLSSAFIMVPVRRSPFVNTIWSANETQQNEKNHTTDKIRTIGIAPSEMFMLSSCVCLDSQTIAAAEHKDACWAAVNQLKLHGL